MVSLKKIPALVLVIVMIFSMLPVLATAEDAVSEAPAVETVEAPAAEAPAAAEAPSSVGSGAAATFSSGEGTPAVEDVSVIPEAAPADAVTEIPAEAPAVEAIETVAAEDVKAELQALAYGNTSFATDAAAVGGGYFLKLVIPSVGTAYYNDFQNASYDFANNVKAGSVLSLLCDYTYYNTTATTLGIINCNPSSVGAAAQNKGGSENLAKLTFNLEGNTLTARCKRPVISRGVNVNSGFNLCGGRILYQNLGNTNRCAILYGNASFPTNTNGNAKSSTIINLTDMTCICLAPISGYTTPVISTNHWVNTVNVSNSVLISEAGSAMEFLPVNASWNSDTSTTQIGTMRGSANDTIINLTGTCVIGSLASTPAVRYAYPSDATAQSINVGFTITPDTDKKSAFLGSEIYNVEVASESTADRLTITAPDDYTVSGSYRLALPDTATLAGSSSAAKPDFLAASDYTAKISTSHTHTVVEHAAVAPTFAAAGNSAYWACPICGKFFSNEECTAESEISENSWVGTTPALSATDTAGLEDADMVELGAVAKTVAPGGSPVKAFTNPNAAYLEGASWTTAGGVVKMLCDYTYVDAAKGAYGIIDSGAQTASANHSAEYVNADNASYPDIDLKGFWFDLNGKTLVVRSGSPIFGPLHSLPVNIKNGTILYQDTAAGNSAYGAFKYGTTKAVLYSATEIYRPVFTLDRVTFITLPRATAASTSAVPIFCLGQWQSEINIIDSTIINCDGKNVITYYKATPDGGASAFALSQGFQHTVNVSGNSIIGSSNNTIITCDRYGNDNTGENADYIRLNVKGDNVRFLGTGLANIVRASLLEKTILPTDYYSLSTKFTYTIPDVATLRTTTGVTTDPIGYQAAPTQMTQWVKRADSGSLTETPSEAAATLQFEEQTLQFTTLADALYYAERLSANTGINPTLTVKTAVEDLGFAADDSFTVEAKEYFTEYSLNLDENVKINLYTKSGENAPGKVYYVQGEAKTPHTITTASGGNDWVVTTLSAAQMGETIDAYAIKKDGGKLYVDSSKGLSVKGYTQSNPAAGETNATIANRLNATLKTMMIYGKYAEKYFSTKQNTTLTDEQKQAILGASLNSEELESIGVASEPSTVTSNLTHETRTVSAGLGDHTVDASGFTSGFYGTSAVLADSLHIKFYFYGMGFNSASVDKGTIKATEADGGYQTVKVAVDAKDFDTLITVTLKDSGNNVLGSVTDSLSAYTSRIADTDNSYKLAQALRAYGADAIRYAEAKAGT